MNEIPKIFKSSSHKDNRGVFSKLLSNIQNKKILKKDRIIEINYSFNKIKGTIRGFHYQIGKFKEKKLIYCLTGKILDVSINIDKKSKNFNKIYKFILEEKKNNFIVIPKNYAHGFQVLKKNTTLIYLHTAKYKKKLEKRINPIKNKINWPLKVTRISNIDKKS
jgi:dTDP-4-dehydrorhamnose 3,5-epimerase